MVECARNVTDLANRKVLVVGLGSTGKATITFLKERGAHITVSEVRKDEEVRSALPMLEEQGITVEWGEHRIETFLQADLIVVSPGVSLHLPPLKAAAARGIEIISEIELASRYIHIPIIAVTGTNGKTTTVHLIAEIFKASGMKIFLGGNVGTPLIEYVSYYPPADYLISEISSFQLEGIRQFTPYISVLLNIDPDHLDRYRSFEEYRSAKIRIFMNQSAKDYALLNADDPQVKTIAPSLKATVLYFSSKGEVSPGIHYRDDCLSFTDGTTSHRFTLTPLYLKGIHNWHNIMAATVVSILCGCPPETIKQVIEHFRGLPHRLEFFKEVNHIKFYDDSKATNVSSAVRALESLPPPLILIAGGKDKGGSYQPLIPLIKEKVKALILVGEAKEKMYQQLGSYTTTSMADSFEEAVRQALHCASPGDTVILSPACSSFDMFKNFEERGETFKNLVHKLT